MLLTDKLLSFVKKYFLTYFYMLIKRRWIEFSMTSWTLTKLIFLVNFLTLLSIKNILFFFLVVLADITFVKNSLSFFLVILVYMMMFVIFHLNRRLCDHGHEIGINFWIISWSLFWTRKIILKIESVIMIIEF